MAKTETEPRDPLRDAGVLAGTGAGLERTPKRARTALPDELGAQHHHHGALMSKVAKISVGPSDEN